VIEGVPEIASIDVDVRSVFETPKRRDAVERSAVGRRGRSLVSSRRGKYSRHRLARPGDYDIAVDATLRAAAMRAGRRHQPLRVTTEDVRRRVREHRVPFDICFVVDNSYSLHADRVVERAKGLVYRLLEDAAQHGDRVSLVAFRPGTPEATVVLPPTGSLRAAARRLREIPLSGRTPLAGALAVGGRLLRQQQTKRPHARPLVVVVSDGMPNVSLRAGGDPVADTLHQARALKRARIGVIVVDSNIPGRGRRESCSPGIATAAGGICLPLAELAPEAFAALFEAET
jgi:magnesium chelatase subunit D